MALDRRSFLARLALGGATLVVAGTGALGYRAYDQGVFATGRGDAYDPWRDWDAGSGPRALIAAAILAANPHNIQPWVFAVRDDRIHLYADPTRSLGAADPFDREKHVGLGCALENLCLAAAAQGFDPRVELGPAGDPALVATVTLAPGRPTATELYRVIPQRHTNRGAYKERDIAHQALTALSELADTSTAPASLRWLIADDRDRFGQLMVAATEAFIADHAQSEASFTWYRQDWDAVQRHKDGLTVDGQGLPDLQRAAAKLLPRGSRGAGDDFWLNRTRDVHVKTAAAFGIISVPDPADIAQRLAGGRLLERIHLWAVANDLALQHMNQVTERVDREADLGRPDGTARALLDIVGAPVLVSFRIGYPTITARRSPRHPVEEVTR